MSVSYSLHYLLAVWSVLTGMLLGFLYEFFRLLHRVHPQLSWLIFLEDLLYCLFCTGGMLLLFFNLSFGRMRMYAFVGVALGFAVWYFTLGKLFGKALSRFARLLRPRAAKAKAHFCTRREAFCMAYRAKKGFGAGKWIWRKTDA